MEVSNEKELNFYDVIWFVLLSSTLLGLFIGGLALLPSTSKEFLQANREYLALFIFAEQALRVLPVFLLVMRKKSGSFFSSIGFKKVSFTELILYPIIALCVAWELLVVLQGLMHLYGVTSIPGLSGTQENLFSIFGTQSWSIYVVFFSAAIIAPILEEITYRGFLQKILLRYCSPITSSILTATLFSLVHMQLQVALPLFILGFILSILYTKTQSIWPGIVFHILNNSISLLALLLL